LTELDDYLGRCTSEGSLITERYQGEIE